VDDSVGYGLSTAALATHLALGLLSSRLCLLFANSEEIWSQVNTKAELHEVSNPLGYYDLVYFHSSLAINRMLFNKTTVPRLTFTRHSIPGSILLVEGRWLGL